MLINTVILFLRDALPIFVLLGYLLAQVNLSKRWILAAFAIGLVLALMFIQQVDRLGNLFAGTGLEISLFLLHFCLYLLVLLLGYILLAKYPQKLRASVVAVALIVIIIVAKGTNFLLYFNGHISQLDALQAMSIGTFLGLGICLSLAILLYFFMVWLKVHYGAIGPWSVLLVFATGQLIDSMNLLIQVDLLPFESPAWHSNWLIDEESEYGHLLNVLLGYVDSPSILQICLYVLLIIAPLIQYWRVRHFTQDYRGIRQ